MSKNYVDGDLCVWKHYIFATDIMEGLRNKLLKSIFALILLSVLALKVCAFSISYFSSSTDAFSIEKSAEENKDKEEEALDKNKKKLMLYESSIIDVAHYFCINHSPLPAQHYHVQMDAHPPKSVPTPPPDLFS